MTTRIPSLVRVTFAIALASLAFAGAAVAQPMIDPSKMSGIPRPDREVPPGVLSVRVLRGDFAHPLVGQLVRLEGDGGPFEVKVDDTDHAVFKDLHLGSTYVAKSTAFDVTLESQPVTMPESTGVKLMLVFPQDEAAELGAPDGKARRDVRLAPGVIAVKVVDGDDKPLGDVEVVLARATRESKIVEEQRLKTAADGTVRFTTATSSDGQPAAFAVKALHGDATVASDPFKLTADHGVLVGLRSVPLTHDAGALTIGDRSHLIMEVRDDDVQVVENLYVDNSTGAPFDPGPAGLRLPLPDGAEGAQVAGDESGAPSPFTLDGKDVLLKGRLPTGETELRVGFLLPVHDAAVTLRQKTPVPFLHTKVITDRFEDMTVDGNNLAKEERAMPGGRAFWLLSGDGTKAGGELYLRLAGLPHATTTWRYVATGTAALILVWGLFAAAVPRSSRRPRTARERLELESRRVRLLDQIAALPADEKGATDGGKGTAERSAMLAELEQIYRQLDEDAA